MKLPVAIIEDEPATARNLARLLLEAEPDIEVLAVLTGVHEAVNWLKINMEQCSLLLMDIHLSDGLSFEIFETIPVDKPVIFVTAYDEYALKAFRAGGIDYLLKPFEAADVTAAIQKFKRLVNTPAIADYNHLLKIARDLKAGASVYRQSFLVHYRNKLIPLNVQEIAWFYTVNEVVYANTSGGASYIIELTLEQLQQELNPHNFFRANRQFIISRECIKEVEYYFNGRLFVVTHPLPAEKVIVSKARAPEFKQWMNR
ncbi:LytR/AlgR family response regulator transcription factor [Foetidibacter luteolus]|uniref:LytR/AlgR family response regulator transcription factor n=1 Tax=Foetidibacter luteolus TaxID=2608880 RepID=UPI00129B4A34|nr:LytTR family DNA-binding domain-containing protein [Foetidibacter luteolus]